MSPFSLRAYEPADFETLYAIDRSCYPRGIAYSRRTLRSYLSPSNSDCLVAESQAQFPGEIRGFIIAVAEGYQAHIITIDVAEQHRRGGVGSALLSAMEQQLVARGTRGIALETAISNQAGVSFWQRHGYRFAGVLRRYYLDRLDAYWMLKTFGEENH